MEIKNGKEKIEIFFLLNVSLNLKPQTKGGRDLQSLRIKHDSEQGRKTSKNRTFDEPMSWELLEITQGREGD